MARGGVHGDRRAPHPDLVAGAQPLRPDLQRGVSGAHPAARAARELRGRRGVVEVAVREQHGGHPTRSGVEHRLQVGLVVRPGVDDHDRTAGRVTDHPGVRALERHRSRVQRQHPPQVRRQPLSRGSCGPGGHPPTVPQRGRIVGVARTSATSSTSTGASRGSTATPTALRACWPASPKTSTSSRLAPFATAGLSGEARRAGDEDDDLDHAGDRVDAAHLVRDRRHRVEHRQPSALGRRLGGDLRADLARGREPALDHRQLTGGVHEVPDPHRRDVGRQRGHHGGQGQPLGGQPLRGRAHAAAPVPGRGRFR